MFLQHILRKASPAVAGLFWLAVAGLGAWAWLTLADVRGDYLRPLWTAHRLVKTNARVESVYRANDGIVIRYRYQVGERTYRSERLTFDPQRGQSDSGTVRDLFMVYGTAQRHALPVTAWVDPSDPEFAVLDKGVQWVPVSASTAALLLLALLIAAALQRALQAVRLDKLAAAVAGNAPTREGRFPWAIYRAVALIVVTVNVMAWTFVPGGAASMVTTLAGAITLAYPLLALRRVLARWRMGHKVDGTDDRHWSVLATSAGRGVRILDPWVTVFITACWCAAGALLAWVGYVLVTRSYFGDALSLVLGALGGLGAAAIAWMSGRSALRIEFKEGWLIVERGQGARVERLGQLRARELERIESLPDPLGYVASDSTGNWRVFARMQADGTAAPLTPLVSASLARAIAAHLNEALRQVRSDWAPSAAPPLVYRRSRAPLLALMATALVLAGLIGHWQWQRVTVGVSRVLPDGSVLTRQPLRDPLERAIYSRKVSAIQEALAAGANPDAPNSEGARPLHLAAMLQAPEVMAVLLRAGANVNAPHAGEVGGNHATPLMWAAGQPQLADMLLAAGADPLLRDSTGASAMHYAARHNSPAVLALLHSRGLPIEDRSGPDGATPVMWAFWWWAPEAIDWLVARGAALDGKDLRGFEFEHYARTSKEPELALARLRQLRANGAAPSRPATRG